MEAPMLGAVVVVIAVLTSAKFGWELRGDAKVILMFAGVGFALGLALPAFALDHDGLEARRLLIGGSVATAAGALLLVMGVLLFSRRVPSQERSARTP